MTTTLTVKGQVTIPKQIRVALNLQPGCKINFAVNEAGEVLLQKQNLAAKNHRIKVQSKAPKKTALKWSGAGPTFNGVSKTL